MTPKERLLRAIRGQPVDRFPIAPRIWRFSLSKGKRDLDLAREYGFELLELGRGILTTPFDESSCSGVTGLTDGVAIEVSTRREDEKTYYSRVFRTPGGTLSDEVLLPDAGGGYGIQPSLERIEPPVKSASDLELLHYLLPDPVKIRGSFPRMREWEEEIGDQGLIGYRPSRGVDHIVVDSLGIEQALISSLVDPGLLRDTIDVVDNWHTAIIREILDDGWKIIFDPWYNFSLSFGWSPEFYRTTVAPLIKKHADLAHSYEALLFFYDDGRMKDSIEHIVDAGVDIIQTLTPPPAGDIDFGHVARTVGGQACLNGGMDTVAMRFCDTAEVVRQTKNALDILGPTRRFILGSSDSFTEGTPDENIRAYFKTGKEYGRVVANRVFG